MILWRRSIRLAPVTPPFSLSIDEANNGVTDCQQSRSYVEMWRAREFLLTRQPAAVSDGKERVMRPEHPIHVFINKKKFDLDNPVQTGASLKQLAGIPLADVLFLQQPGEDQVIANDTSVTLKNGDQLHSQPAADYGFAASVLAEAGLEPDRAELHSEPGGWSLLVISNYLLPVGFQPNRVQLLVKLPPAFPDAAPDMFWVWPGVKAPNGALPRSTSTERLLGKDWQRFSWHLAAGAWKPGISTLRDYLRCIRARFLRLD